jgi:acetyl esterase/lipase
LIVLGGDPAKVVVGGISAGANLAAAVVLRENSRTKKRFGGEGGGKMRIKGQVLSVPWLVLHPGNVPYHLYTSRDKSWRVQCAGAPVLPIEAVDFFAHLLGLKSFECEGGKFEDVGAVEDKAVAGLPSTALLVAGRDPLRDDGLLYARKLHENR